MRKRHNTPTTSAELGNRAGCGCSIIPADVLERFANDTTLPDPQRKSFADAARLEKQWRQVRSANAKLSRLAQSILPTNIGVADAAALPPPTVSVFDCMNGNSRPGTPVPNPGSSADATAKRTFSETTEVARFYQSAFGRNSIDNAGMALISSIHFSVNYNNAFWDGSQMTYGDGDGNIFLDFTLSNDVIAHELTHGVTEHTGGFVYSNEPGGLNESMSDVFGSMFRQWRAGQTVANADWLIGKDIMGPGSKARGYTCLRDLSAPSGAHCLAPQVTKYSQYTPGMDPHDSSGIPNGAFYKAATAIGGKSWEKTGKIWYEALSGSGPAPNMKMIVFADKTRAAATRLFPTDPSISKAVDKAWKAVGL